MAIASSLIQVLKNCCQACPPGILMPFTQGSIPENLVKEKKRKKKKIDEVIQHLLKVTIPKEY